MSAPLISSVATPATAASLYSEQKQSGQQYTSFSNNSVIISDWFNGDRDYNRDRRWNQDRDRQVDYDRNHQWNQDRNHQWNGDQNRQGEYHRY